MCRKEVERAHAVSTFFWSLDYEESTLGVFSNSFSKYPLHVDLESLGRSSQTLLEEVLPGSCTLQVRCSQGAPTSVEHSVGDAALCWCRQAPRIHLSHHIPRFQKQNAMGLTFLDVLLLAGKKGVFSLAIASGYVDVACSASMK